jgi:biotin transport system permease protein
MMTSYLARRTFLHDVPAGLKLAGLAALSFLLLPVQDWRVLGAGAVAAALVFILLGRDACARLRLLRPLIPLLVMIAALHVVTGDWRDAASATLRLLLMVMLAELVTMTTTMAAMMAALAPLLRPLRYIGFNPQALTLAVALVIRFVPVLLETWQRRTEAWRARGGNRGTLRLVAPFVGDALRLADHVAEALTARGFTPSSRRTPPP